MAYELKITTRFKQNAKLCKKRGLPMEELWNVVGILVEQGALPQQYRPHMLTGQYHGFWECHIRPDWLLIWQQNDTELILTLTNTGSHSDLFGKSRK